MSRLYNLFKHVLGIDDEADDGIDIVIQEPEFERVDDVEPDDPPLTPEAIDELKQAGPERLRAMGLQKYSEDSGLWLFPYEWHGHIPTNYTFQSILGEEVTRADYPDRPDKRFGALSFGIVPEFEKEER